MYVESDIGIGMWSERDRDRYVERDIGIGMWR